MTFETEHKFHLGLFEGVAGFSLGAAFCGYETIATCEINPFCNVVLDYWFPNSERLTDIKTTCFKKYYGKIKLLTGGAPCQPFSSAGKQLGTDDPRHLWPEMFRAIRECRPDWVLFENVYGFIDWNGGLVLDSLVTDLESENYEVVTPFILPACGQQAPHRRYRVWVVAKDRDSLRRSGDLGQEKPDERRLGDFSPGNTERLPSDYKHAKSLRSTENPTDSNGNGRDRSYGENEEQPDETGFDALGNVKSVRSAAISGEPATDAQSQQGERSGPKQPRNSEQREEQSRGVYSESFKHAFTDTSSEGLQGSEIFRDFESEWPFDLKQFSGLFRSRWEDFPTQPPVCGGDDGLSYLLDPDTVFKAYGKPTVKTAFNIWREEAVKAYGNAIVWQLAARIIGIMDAMDLL